MTALKRFSAFLNRDTKAWIRALVLMLSGALTGLTIAIPEIGFLEWITIVPAAIILLKRGFDGDIKLKRIYLDGFIFFYGFYLVCYHFFLSMYPLDFISGMTDGTAAAAVAVCWLGMALLQSLMGGLVFLLAALIFRGRICKRVKLLAPIVIAALWVIFEWSQNFGWWGVPWGRLALAQTKNLIGIQNASWFGSYFISFLIVSVNFFIAYALLNLTEKRAVRIASITVLSMIVFQYSTGAIIWFTTDINEGETVKVACVQGNISASNEWDSDTIKQIEKVYWEGTRKAAEEGAEIIVWTETAIPFIITSGDYTKYDERCKALAKETGTYILVGAYADDEKNSYNSLICYAPDGTRYDRYDKQRLVPFAEYLPLKSFFEVCIPVLTKICITFDNIALGEETTVMNIDGADVGSLICFDSIYEGLTLDAVRNGAELICLSTNDSWFSGSAALTIHKSHAQLRSIESGRYITRSASTGISAIISPRGETMDIIEADTEGVLVYDVHLRQNRTLYSVLGNVFVYLCLAFCAFFVVDRTVLKIKEKLKKT
ncbi:MAG: apolipoprotein N-acyltransferase [Clostridia bacterium]|nr:apolipoprotein N-acyltransferase [Clostridia bacterium]